MAENNSLKEKSLLSLYIFEILRKFSNKESPMTEKEIKKKINKSEIFKDANKIKKDDRKIIPRHVQTLVEHFKGLIVKEDTKKNQAAKWYYDESKSDKYELLKHFPQSYFTLEEITFLTHMIHSNKLLTEQSSAAFIDKLMSFLDDSDKKIAKENYESFAKATRIIKNENQYVHEIFDRLQDAIKSQKYTTITINSDETELCQIKNANVYAIYKRDAKGQVYVCVQENGECIEIKLSEVKHVDLLSKSSEYDTSIVENLEKKGFVIIDEYDRSNDLEIFNDTLFTNLRLITTAKNKGMYLSFKDFDLWNRTAAVTRTITPLKTILEDDNYYLVAIENTCGIEKPIYIKVTLMDDLRLGKKLSAEERKKLKFKEESLHTDPFIHSKSVRKKVRFIIKKEAIQQVNDGFKETLSATKANPFDNTSELIKAIGESDAESFTKSFTGYNYGEELVRIEVDATEDDAFRWALRNAEVVEIERPMHLRLKLLEIAQNMSTRYSRSSYDREQKHYHEVITGEEFLTLGSAVVHGGKTTYQDSIYKRISKERAYSKIEKLKIQNTETPISKEELEKYINVEELVIDGNGFSDFSWIASLPSLRCLTLKNTTIESGDMLSKIPHLDVLFLNENRCLQNYDFLIDMDVDTLCLGHNGSADISPLYKLRKTERLILKESMLWDIDMEKIQGFDNDSIRTRRHVRVERWIKDTCLTRLPTSYSINYQFLPQRKPQ